MTFTKRYKNILKTEKDIAEIYHKDYCIQNNIITDVSILITGHFDNCVSINLGCEAICLFPLYNSTHNIGYIIRCLIALFDKDHDGSVNINELVNTPIRIVFDHSNLYCGKAVAIGHFMKDQFVLIEDLMKLDKLDFM